MFPIQKIVVGDDVKETMAPPYAIMLEEFADVFQPVPSGLPLEWEMAHTIPLMPNGKTIFISI